MRSLRLYLKYKLFLARKLWVTTRLVPAVQVCMGLISAMILADLLPSQVTILLGILLLVCGRRRLLLLSLAFLIGFGWYLLWFNPGRVEQIQSFVGQTIALQVTVIQDPVVSDSWQRVVVSSFQLPQFVQLEIPTYPRLVIGDKIAFTATLGGLGDLEGGYANYLAGQGIFYIARSQDFLLIGTSDNPLFLVGRLKDTIVAKIASLLNPPSSQVLLGLLVGGQGEFPPDLKQQFIETGITHIFSVSGYNVGIVILAFLSLAGVIHRRLLAILAMVGLLAFGAMVGPGNPAAVRAVIMGELVLITLWLGRTKILPLMLLYAVVIMLLIYPLAWRNVSMQLSVAAMIGILCLRQVWEKHLEFLP
ncbi:ComEC/Rec2 family competence protein, partial [Candidatus Dojkabacteria bacterium]|nr:ComEC/Rec2 family competence protein [Candidatus Dojkabacteria bacterium]